MDREKKQQTQKNKDKDQNEGDSSEETLTTKKILSDTKNQSSDDQKKNDNHQNSHHRQEEDRFNEKGNNITQIQSNDKQYLDESVNPKHLDVITEILCLIILNFQQFYFKTEKSRTETSEKFTEEQVLIQAGIHILKETENFCENWHEWFGKNENDGGVQQAKTNLVKLTQSIIRDIYEFNKHLNTHRIVINYYAVDGFDFKFHGWRYRLIFFKYVNDFDDVEEFMKYFLIANILFLEQEKAIGFHYLNIDFFLKFINKRFEDQTINKIMEEANQIIQNEDYKYYRKYQIK